MDRLDLALEIAVGYAWGMPLIVLLIGGGLFLLIYCRFLPFLQVRHSLELIGGRFDRPDDPGEINHFQALSTALAATIGLGNIGGVAIAITQGGPGAVFWMWVAAVVGMATKFFSCTLAVMYRRKHPSGIPLGGPMYYIELGLGPRFRPLAVFFALCGMVGCLAMFQTNQVAEVLVETYRVPTWATGLACTAFVALVILGGLKRIALVVSRLVPAMCLLYFVSALVVVAMNAQELPRIFMRVFHDAFTGTAAFGGAAGIGFIMVLQTGIKRGAFSNEAGIGTAPLAHGAAKTKEAVREGVVAMLGPFIDTLVICTLTAVVILSTGLWRGDDVRGVGLTTEAFESALGPLGKFVLVTVVIMFGLSTMISYSYYGRKCFGYLFGTERDRIYEIFYLAMLFVGALWTAAMVVNLIDTAFALMAFPNMIAVLLLSPRVMREARGYFARLRAGEWRPR